MICLILIPKIQMVLTLTKTQEDNSDCLQDSRETQATEMLIQ